MLPLLSRGACSACSPTLGPTTSCGTLRSCYVFKAARHRAERAAGTALNPVSDSQCGIDAMWRDRCDACSALNRWKRTPLTRCRRSSCGAGLQLTGDSLKARTRQPRQNQSDRADDVAVVPADAYEYRHLHGVAQP